ncbi:MULTISPECIES: helix-turn-helix domain-containing protein [Enterobacteriaceae]|uniref:helix-turn-helix domain-containing protein n=1 Tax=Enterobacteriaceae TaxID=543 RepID=UPI0007B33666|nr:MULTISPECIES: helix-turn-helix transcriptional regulator [Enterobacteriaceae]KZQ03895.1 transcriptional regulator [Enterobacter kobei]MDR6246850.1 putative transcriptional regulator [Klebsiella variicola]MDR6252384.1 putative transcriptional regulator [Klebsiella variicola]MDR6257801.1 putative transcriptional regulator [Klebsiella sp. SORGH_AS_0826]MDR6271494.1 putative transcriptional regulator [Klebsiella variicola]
MAVVVHLDKLLVEKKMTSRALAAFIGITEQNLSLLKSGKVKGIRFDTLAKICEAMECQPGDIISWEPDLATPEED